LRRRIIEQVAPCQDGYLGIYLDIGLSGGILSSAEHKGVLYGGAES
jgi:hypothetical protein